MADFEGDDAVESVRCFKLQLLVKRRVQFPFGEAANLAFILLKWLILRSILKWSVWNFYLEKC